MPRAGRSSARTDRPRPCTPRTLRPTARWSARAALPIAYRVADGAGGWREVEEVGRTVEVGGRPYRVGAMIDVTERVEAQRARARYEAIVELQTEWIVRQAPDGRNTFVNDAYCRFRGMPREKLTDPHHVHLEGVMPGSLELFLRNRTSLGPECPQVTTEIEVFYDDGTTGWQVWTDMAILDEAGRVVEYQCVGGDTTEQHNARAALEASEARYRGVVEAQNDLITRVRPDGRATFVNDAYCRYMGMTREQLLDPGWDDLHALRRGAGGRRGGMGRADAGAARPHAQVRGDAARWPAPGRAVAPARDLRRGGTPDRGPGRGPRHHRATRRRAGAAGERGPAARGHRDPDRVGHAPDA